MRRSRRVSARNLVIGGDTYTWGNIPVRLWIENLRLPNGRPPRMDLYGHNPFSYRDPNLANPPSPDGAFDFSDLGRLSRLVNRYLARHGHLIKLFLSEWTIPTSPFDDEFNFYVTPAVQARGSRTRGGSSAVRRSSTRSAGSTCRTIRRGMGAAVGFSTIRATRSPGTTRSRTAEPLGDHRAVQC